MLGLDNLRTRLNYQGGITAESRIQKDKERSLKKALLYSYQAETAILSDGREFRCLINTDRTKADYDVKIISIPYEDICLGVVDKDGVETRRLPDGKTSQKIEKIGMKCGDTFKWKETNTYWIVYLEKLSENAYFRAEIYKCEEKVVINNKEYPIYIRGPVETEIQWREAKGNAWNDLNYSLIIYITKNEDTLDYFHRFKEIKIGRKNWEVKTVDPYSADGIIEVCLGEYFTNTLNDYYKEEQEKKIKEANKSANTNIYIEGQKIVYPYEKHKYVIHGISDGKWSVNNNKKAIIKEPLSPCTIVEFITGKSGKVDLSYTTKDRTITLPIEIHSI